MCVGRTFTCKSCFTTNATNARAVTERGRHIQRTDVSTLSSSRTCSTSAPMSGISKNAAIDGPTENSPPPKFTGELNVHYISYGSEKESSYLPAIRQLISKDLSEPYSIYVYRYFLYQWGDLCFMVSTNPSQLDRT